MIQVAIDDGLIRKAHALIEGETNEAIVRAALEGWIAAALDELWTKTTPAIDTRKPGYFTRHMAHMVEVDDLSVAWLHAKADSTGLKSCGMIML